MLSGLHFLQKGLLNDWVRNWEAGLAGRKPELAALLDYLAPRIAWHDARVRGAAGQPPGLQEVHMLGDHHDGTSARFVCMHMACKCKCKAVLTL